MIIGIDGNEANVERKVGISEYAFELLLQFKKKLSPPLEYKIYLKQKPSDDFPKETKEWKYRIVGPRRLWTQIGLPFDLFMQKNRPDVFFTPTHYAPRFSPTPTAIAVMDLSYLHFPDMFKASDLYQLKQWTGYSVKNAKKILTISKASKNDIITAYNVPEEKVIVTYPGIKQAKTNLSSNGQKANMDTIRKQHGINGDYILFVGTLQPRKNIERLIEAFSLLKKNNITLVIVGRKGWLYEDIISAPVKFHVQGLVKFLDFVNEEDLAVLYKFALFFILPSLYEGFGLPILEAMQYGCPVITSNVSSMPEAGGGAALYTDPENVEDIAQKMQTLIDTPALRKELVEKGYKQVKKFSWEKTAQQTLDVLQSIVDQK